MFGKYTILPILEMIMMTDRSIIQEEFGIFGSPWLFDLEFRRREFLDKVLSFIKLVDSL